jgi:hypothetical protein
MPTTDRPEMDSEEQEFTLRWMVTQEPSFFCMIGDRMSIDIDADVWECSLAAAARRYYVEKFGEVDPCEYGEPIEDEDGSLAYACMLERNAERGGWFGYGD